MTEAKVYNSVSRFQFPMLREFCMAVGFVSVMEAARLDQRPFGFRSIIAAGSGTGLGRASMRRTRGARRSLSMSTRMRGGG